MDNEAPPGPPDRNLVSAILFRAIKDYLDKNPHRTEAYLWIMRESNDPLSFVWCCEELDISPKKMRKKIWEYEANGLAFAL